MGNPQGLTESATENNRLRVRVKMWGKSPHKGLVTNNWSKPCVLKCQIGKRLRAARFMLTGWQIDSGSNA